MIALGELRKLLDRLPYGAGLFTSEGEGAFKYFNDNYYRLTGYSRGEYAALDGDDINKLIYPPDISKISDMAELLRHEDHAVSDCRIIQKNGRINRISIDASRIELKEYPVLLICFRAVTEETCSQTLTDHLALEQERYRLILERAHALIIELNCVTGEFYTSESFNDYAMADIDSDVLFSGQAAQDTVHPDDVHILRSFFDSKLEPDKNSDCLLRLKMKDGSYRWSRMFGTLTKDSDGNPLRAIAAIMEVNNTTESSVIIKNLVEAMPGGIAVFKAPPHTECMYINDAILDMIDYTRDELMDLINKNGDLRSMVYPEDRAVFDVEISEQAKNGAPINCDLRYYTGTGKHIEWIHISAVRIRENMDNPLYYCILSRPSEESKIFRQISHDSMVAELALEYPSGKVLYGNRAFRDLAGIPEHISLTGYELKGLMDRRDYNDITACSNAIQKKGSIDTMLTTSSGKTLQLQGRTMDWVGKNTSLFYFSDQTAVQQHNQWLINIINSVPVGMGIYEIHSDRIQQLYLNDSFYKMLGDTRENRSKFFDYSYLDAIHPEDVHLFNESISSLIAGADHSDITYRVINGEGKYIWFHMVGNVNSTDDDRRIVYCSFFDIDREMTSQLTLRESRQVLHHAMSTAKMYSFRFDVKNRTLSYEEDFQEDYNYGKPVVFDVPDSIIAEGRVHPNSVDDFRSLFCTVAPEDKPLLKDIFIKRSGRGNYRWERIIMTPSFDRSGDHIVSIGLALDITDQKSKDIKYNHQLQLMDSANSSDLIAKVLYNLTTGETEAYLGKSPDAVDKDDAKYYSCGMKATASLFADKKEAAGFVSMFNREELLHQFSIGCNHFSYDYKRFARTGDVFWANTQCTLFSEPESDDVMCFLYTYDIDEQKTNSDMVNAVVWMDYDYIGLLDCRSKRFSIRSKSSEDSGETPIHSYEDYDSNMASFMRKNVAPEMQDAAINDMRISNITAELKKSGSFTCFLPLLHPSGRISRKKLRFSYLDEFNERVLITQLDITDVYLQEQERVKELNDAAKALEKANNAKTDFLSRMSHDLRTPMNAIVGLSELAINNVYDEATMSEYISDINSAGKFLLGLVNDCLDTEKLAAGKMVLAPEPYPYSRFHANLKTMIEPLCKKKNIEFHFVDSKHQPLVYMDPVRMEQIFMNLLTNAVKFTPEGGKVEFNIKSGSNTANIIHCDFIVKDNGVGISEEFQQRMFEPFEQEEGSYASGSQGTGLGLSIVKSLVDLMGGTIDVISKKGVGSRFTVHLDMPVSSEAEAEMYNYPDNDDGHSLSGKRILLAEDHPLNAKIAVNLLESRSVKVYCASNGKECLDMFAGSAPGYYDAILMDIRMPVMDGLTAAASIRSLDRKDAASVPIIAMTANAFDEDVKATRDAGMNQHLSKPIHPVKLYMSLEYWIQKYRG